MRFTKKNIITYITVALVLTAMAIAVITSIQTQREAGLKTEIKGSEDPISPVSENLKTDNSEVLDKKSKVTTFELERFYLKWSNIFNIICFNTMLFPKDSVRKFNEFEYLRTNLFNKKMTFTYGNVNELVEAYGDVIKEQCNHYKLDWRLILAMIRQESYFNPEAVSRAGAYGLMQIMPGTGLGLQNELKLEDTKTPYNNLTAGMYYYATLAASFEFTGEDKIKFALAAYNAGLGRVVDAMTIANYFGKDYNKWDNVKEYYPYLASNQDSVHRLVWPKTGRPPGGTLNNWQEPYKYVEYIMFYYENYKKIYPGNLTEEKKTKKKKNK
ncbi:MAG TPA: transglycosylase SLT domain-containing protein [Ignavibacteria bacterium]|nr:transglycosylase SLT domain-containing protein [Ignavibacteria bacterium]